jgi:hypothetical protein
MGIIDDASGVPEPLSARAGLIMKFNEREGWGKAGQGQQKRYYQCLVRTITQDGRVNHLGMNQIFRKRTWWP